VVLTYKTSGIFNVAHGAIAMIAAYTYFTLSVTVGLPPWLSMVIAVLVVGPTIGLLLDQVLFRRISDAGAAAKIATTVGLLIFARAAVSLVYGGASRSVPDFLPRNLIDFGAIVFGINQLIIAVLGVFAAGGLALFFRVTRTGTEMRAVVDNRQSAELVGIDSRRVVTVGWVIGCTFAAFSGVLLAPIVGLDTLTIPILVAHSFAAAVVTGLTRVQAAFVAAIAIGIGEALTTKFVAHVPSLPGLSQSLPFLLMFVVLFLARGRLLDGPSVSAQRSRATAAFEGWRPLTRPVAVLVVAAAALAPAVVSGSRLVTLTNAAVFVTLFASLNLLIGLSRQLSLCHAAFAAMGAVFYSHLVDVLPFPLALVAAGACVLPFGAVIAVVSIRLSALFLALATFALGLSVENLLYGTDFAFGVGLSVSAARPGFLQGPNAYYGFAVAMAIGAVLVVGRVSKTRVGRALVAAGDSTAGLASIGIDVQRVRIVVFCLSTWMAAVGGALLLLQFETLGSSSGGFLVSLVWVVAVVAAGASSTSGLLLAVGLFVVLPTATTNADAGQWLELAFGFGAVVLAQANNGVDGLLRAMGRVTIARVQAARPQRRPGVRRMRPTVPFPAPFEPSFESVEAAP
jgi:branched-subunit amino acid ABC-type transport system permease component